MWDAGMLAQYSWDPGWTLATVIFCTGAAGFFGAIAVAVLLRYWG